MLHNTPLVRMLGHNTRREAACAPADGELDHGAVHLELRRHVGIRRWKRRRQRHTFGTEVVRRVRVAGVNGEREPWPSLVIRSVAAGGGGGTAVVRWQATLRSHSPRVGVGHTVAAYTTGTPPPTHVRSTNVSA